ncbi:hypothetical protein MUY14_26365 [Amycolatopsis sp. FBCC-B4732]|uniref:hypothetical protein n=1 Tax=Amycolatopsis sp. FBCC-B4732 TaxID=3079339 RepID=UPI001FF3499D|nr:hypothetical protein [Amycolatopsis sp. FBCC-B4732]UOX85316.1 hypothetical protein MUY14_26365 [Amycolatopsis sp. FBCC-B4732]
MTHSTVSPDPGWVLEALINFLVGEYQDAAEEYAKGNPHFVDTDTMAATASPLTFLFGLTGGRYGLSPEQLSAIKAEVEATR